MPRYLAIDYGGKRIGLAVADAAPGRPGLASPIKPVNAGGDVQTDVAVVLAAAREYEPDEFVVGLPLNMDGTEGGQAKLARRFGDEFARQSGKPVHFFDERLSSFAAEQMLVEGQFTRKKKKARIDSVAAQVILQSFLDTSRRADTSTPGGDV